MVLNWQTLGHPVACPPACRAGVPRTFEQTRQVDRLHVVAGALARLGFGPSCDLGRSLDKFRTVGEDLASLITLRCTASQRRLPALRTSRPHTTSVPGQPRSFLRLLTCRVPLLLKSASVKLIRPGVSGT